MFCMLSFTARSPVFNAMFKDKCTESESGIVQIEDVSAGAMEKFLHFLYTDVVYDFDNVAEELLYCATKVSV